MTRAVKVHHLPRFGASTARLLGSRTAVLDPTRISCQKCHLSQTTSPIHLSNAPTDDVLNLLLFKAFAANHSNWCRQYINNTALWGSPLDGSLGVLQLRQGLRRRRKEVYPLSKSFFENHPVFGLRFYVFYIGLTSHNRLRKRKLGRWSEQWARGKGVTHACCFLTDGSGTKGLAWK